MKPPVKNFKLSMYPNGDVTQWFAENPALYARMGLLGHNGIDIVRPHGEAMYAVEDGEILEVKDTPEGYGKHLRILSDSKNRAGYYNEWTYGHCDTILVKVGDKVKAGQQIATMGNTGFVVSGYTPYWKNNPYAGTHLHLGLRNMRLMKKGGWTYPQSSIRLDAIDYNNGFKGAIDPYPLLAGLSVTEEAYRAKLLTIRSLANTLISLLKRK